MVGKSRKQFMLTSIFPKNQTKNRYPEYFLLREDAQDKAKKI